MFIIRHPRHRTGVHTDAVTISSGTPGPPIITAILDQPPGRAAYSLAPPGVALSASLIRRIFISVIFFRIPFASPTCAAAASCCVWCTKNDLALVLDPP